jgi:GT2 family glycosyltransferase
VKKKVYPVVSVIVLNWNGKEHILRCLHCIDALKYSKKRLQLIVVDNGSSDGSQKAIRDFLKQQRAKYLQAKLIKLPQNVGAPAAMNRALDQLHESAEFVWKLDNDVIFAPEYLDVLLGGIQKLDNGPFGGISGMIVGSDDSEHACCAVLHDIPRRYLSILRYHTATDALRGLVSSQQIVGLIGPSCLFSRDVFELFGGLDERLFLYYDEIEFCIRLYKENFRFVIEPGARITHIRSASIGEHSLQGIYFLLRNHYLLGLKVFAGWEKRLFVFSFPLWATIRYLKLIRFRDHGVTRSLRTFAYAIRDVIGGTYGPSPKFLRGVGKSNWSCRNEHDTT